MCGDNFKENAIDILILVFYYEFWTCLKYKKCNRIISFFKGQDHFSFLGKYYGCLLHLIQITNKYSY